MTPLVYDFVIVHGLCDCCFIAFSFAACTATDLHTVVFLSMELGEETIPLLLRGFALMLDRSESSDIPGDVCFQVARFRQSMNAIYDQLERAGSMLENMALA